MCLRTPTDGGDNDDILGCDVSEDNDQFLEHEQGLSSHPHHSHQCEVVYKDRHCHTASIENSYILRTESYKQKRRYQHEEQGERELDMVFGDFFLAKLPENIMQISVKIIQL